MLSTQECAAGATAAPAAAPAVEPLSGPPLNEATIELVARRFAVLAEPMRLRLIHALFAGEKSVHDLIRAAGGTQTNVSRHLQTLRHAGILARRKEGIQVFYALADPSIGPLCELVCGTLKQRLASQAEAFGDTGGR